MERSGATAPFRSGHIDRRSIDDSMRKTAALLIILALAWLGYLAWPIYEFGLLVRAIETRNRDEATRLIYFDAVRMSLTNQVVAAYVRRTGAQINPRAQQVSSIALGIAHPVVERLISAQAMS